MIKICIISLMYVFLVNSQNIFAQELDYDPPYLSDEDIVSLETILSDSDDPFLQFAYTVEGEAENETVGMGLNEMPRLNTSVVIYHLLLLDRRFSPGTDIGDMDNMTLLFKYLHGRDGYLIVIYASSPEGPVFPQMPEGSRILINMSSTLRSAIRDYVNSSAFRRFVSNQTILTQLLEVL